jgi:hypothetical protein
MQISSLSCVLLSRPSYPPCFVCPDNRDHSKNKLWIALWCSLLQLPLSSKRVSPCVVSENKHRTSARRRLIWNTPHTDRGGLRSVRVGLEQDWHKANQPRAALRLKREGQFVGTWGSHGEPMKTIIFCRTLYFSVRFDRKYGGTRSSRNVGKLPGQETWFDIPEG